MSRIETEESLLLPTLEETVRIPVLEETARVEKRVVEEHVYVRTQVHARDEVIETLLKSDVLDIERVRLDQVVHESPGIREEGEYVIVPVLEEILVVEKRLILREEIRIRRTQQTRTARETVRLRREEVAIERSSPVPQTTKEI